MNDSPLAAQAKAPPEPDPASYRPKAVAFFVDEDAPEPKLTPEQQARVDAGNELLRQGITNYFAQQTPEKRRQYDLWCLHWTGRRFFPPPKVTVVRSRAKRSAQCRTRGSRRTGSSSRSSGNDPGESDPSGERLCGCGCGSSLEGFAPQARFISDAHRKRASRSKARVELADWLTLDSIGRKDLLNELGDGLPLIPDGFDPFDVLLAVVGWPQATPPPDLPVHRFVGVS